MILKTFWTRVKNNEQQKAPVDSRDWNWIQQKWTVVSVFDAKKRFDNFKIFTDNGRPSPKYFIGQEPPSMWWNEIASISKGQFKYCRDENTLHLMLFINDFPEKGCHLTKVVK